MKNSKNSKTIVITKCSECPFKEVHSMGKATHCGHAALAPTKPYAIDRKVNPDEIADFCPL